LLLHRMVMSFLVSDAIFTCKLQREKILKIRSNFRSNFPLVTSFPACTVETTGVVASNGDDAISDLGRASIQEAKLAFLS
jgi:hypothetical protein